MITVVTGLLGGGKSYYVWNTIAEYLSTGGCVYTNMTPMLDPWEDEHRLDKKGNPTKHKGLKWYLKSVHNWELQEGQLVKVENKALEEGVVHEHLPMGTWQKPVLAAFDETLDFFNSTDRGESGGKLKNFLSFLRHSRKVRVNVVFIAQEFNEINNRIRSLCSGVIECQDSATIKVPGTIFPFPFKNLFLVRQFNKTGRIHIKNRWIPKDKMLFGVYKTEELFQPIKMIEGKKTDFQGLGRKPKSTTGEYPMWVKIAASISLILSIICTYKVTTAQAETSQKPQPGQTPPTETKKTTPAPIEKEPIPPELWEFGPFSVIQRSGMNEIFCNGRIFKTGEPQPEGIVQRCDASRIKIMRPDGGSYWLQDSRATHIPLERETLLGAATGASEGSINKRP